jgi:hypothetical protein
MSLTGILSFAASLTTIFTPGGGGTGANQVKRWRRRNRFP